jgi:hypothetical protein
VSEADTTSGSDPISFTSVPGDSVPLPPRPEPLSQDLWRSLPDDEGAFFDEVSNEFIPAIVLPEAAQDPGEAAATEARRDRRANALWLTLAILVPLVLLGAGRFVKSARAPSVVVGPPQESLQDPPTAAPEPPRREALPPAGAPDRPSSKDDSNPWSEPR